MRIECAVERCTTIQQNVAVQFSLLINVCGHHYHHHFHVDVDVVMENSCKYVNIYRQFAIIHSLFRLSLGSSRISYAQ